MFVAAQPKHCNTHQIFCVLTVHPYSYASYTRVRKLHGINSSPKMIAERGEAVAESPYPVRVLPAAAVANSCQVRGQGSRQAIAGVDAEFEIEGFDAFGNPAPVRLEHLQLSVTISNSTMQVGTRNAARSPFKVLKAGMENVLIA